MSGVIRTIWRLLTNKAAPIPREEAIGTNASRVMVCIIKGLYRLLQLKVTLTIRWIKGIFTGRFIMHPSLLIIKESWHRIMVTMVMILLLLNGITGKTPWQMKIELNNSLELFSRLHTRNRENNILS